MKKKTIILITAMVLALAIATGATLAYLTSIASNVTNSFVSGGFGVVSLREVSDDGNKDIAWFSGNKTSNNINSYTVVPGVDIKKDPQVKFVFDSDTISNAYVYVKITYSTGDTLKDKDNCWLYTKGTNAINGKLTAKINGVDALSVTLGDNWKALNATKDGSIVLCYVEGIDYVSMKKDDNPLANGLSIFKSIEGSDKTIDVSDALTEADLDVFVTKNANYNLSFSVYACQTEGGVTVANAWDAVKNK